jgi:hypothetical protein
MNHSRLIEHNRLRDFLYRLQRIDRELIGPAAPIVGQLITRRGLTLCSARDSCADDSAR